MYASSSQRRNLECIFDNYFYCKSLGAWFDYVTKKYVSGRFTRRLMAENRLFLWQSVQDAEIESWEQLRLFKS